MFSLAFSVIILPQMCLGEFGAVFVGHFDKGLEVKSELGLDVGKDNCSILYGMILMIIRLQADNEDTFLVIDKKNLKISSNGYPFRWVVGIEDWLCRNGYRLEGWSGDCWVWVGNKDGVL